MGCIDVSRLEKKLGFLMRYFILVLCVLATSFGHILFKSTANILKAEGSFIALAFEPVFIAAMFLYGLATIGWIWCLQDIPVSRAYLFMSLAYIFIPLLAWACFGEAPKPQHFISIFLIITGIVFAMA